MKRLLSVFLFVFVLVLAACGNEDALGDEVASDQQDDPVDEEKPDDAEGDTSGED